MSILSIYHDDPAIYLHGLIWTKEVSWKELLQYDTVQVIDTIANEIVFQAPIVISKTHKMKRGLISYYSDFLFRATKVRKTDEELIDMIKNQYVWIKFDMEDMVLNTPKLEEVSVIQKKKKYNNDYKAIFKGQFPLAIEASRCKEKFGGFLREDGSVMLSDGSEHISMHQAAKKCVANRSSTGPNAWDFWKHDEKTLAEYRNTYENSSLIDL